MKNIEFEINELIKKLEFYNNLYYNENFSEISDYEYDMLLRKLQKLEKENPDLIKPNSPSLKVGGKASSSFKKVEHTIQMGSLKNAYSFNELFQFEEQIKNKIKNFSYVVEPKVDGLSVSLEYENGKFVRGSTRGNGFFGEDVTENLKTIKTVPKILNERIKFLEVRAEVYMSIEQFKFLTTNEKNSNYELFKNPRNAASGSLRQKNPLITKKRNLDVIAFNIQQLTGFSPKSHVEALTILRKMGFHTIPNSKILNSINECISEIKEIERNKKNYKFEIDGAVVKINSLEDRKLLGSTSKAPRWAIAFKYIPEQKQTKLKKIEISVGRTGVLTPVAVLEPVNIAKTTVSKATLHNQDFIDRFDIRLGDIVAVRKAGEIIPEIVNVIKHEENSSKYIMPSKCPICESFVVRNEGEAATRCVNLSCPATIVGNLIHFASRNAMNIFGLGEEITKLLVKEKLIKSVADIYRIKIEQLLKLENFAQKSAENLLNSIIASKKNPTWRLIFGLGIQGVGQYTAKIICENFENLLDLINIQPSKLLEISGIGPIVSSNIAKFFNSNKTLDLFNDLKNLGLNLISKKPENGKLEGLYFTITGKIPNLSRNTIKEQIERNGGKVLTNLSAKTNFIIVGEKPSSKLYKAKKLNIKIIDKAKNFEDILNFIKMQNETISPN